MKLKQLWDTAPIKTSKKLPIAIAIISAVIGTIGIQRLDFNKGIGAALVSIGMFLSGLSIMLFVLDEKWVNVKQPKDH